MTDASAWNPEETRKRFKIGQKIKVKESAKSTVTEGKVTVIYDTGNLAIECEWFGIKTEMLMMPHEVE